MKVLRWICALFLFFVVIPIICLLMLCFVWLPLVCLLVDEFRSVFCLGSKDAGCCCYFMTVSEFMIDGVPIQWPVKIIRRLIGCEC